ncbi:MAG: hypothetical protein AAF192_19130, partial [Pseudomonadota bacterium]
MRALLAAAVLSSVVAAEAQAIQLLDVDNLIGPPIASTFAATPSPGYGLAQSFTAVQGGLLSAIEVEADFIFGSFIQGEPLNILELLAGGRPLGGGGSGDPIKLATAFTGQAIAFPSGTVGVRWDLEGEGVFLNPGDRLAFGLPQRAAWAGGDRLAGDVYADGTLWFFNDAAATPDWTEVIDVAPLDLSFRVYTLGDSPEAAVPLPAAGGLVAGALALL